jgi:hypothetical protein
MSITGNENIRIIDVSGKILVNQTGLPVDMSQFTNGIYFYSFGKDNSLPVTGKILLTR